MSGGIISKIIYFWAYMIGVVIFGKFFGLMDDTKSAVIVLIAAAIIYIVWVLGRTMAAKRREEREWQAQQASRKGRGNKRR